MPFFYKMYGTKDKYEEKTSFMAKRLMGYYGVHDHTLTNYLGKIFKGTLHAATNKDYNFMKEYLEPTLMERIKDDLLFLEKKNMNLYLDGGDIGGSDKHDSSDNIEMIELALMKGISVDRSKNRPISEYVKYKDEE